MKEIILIGGIGTLKKCAGGEAAKNLNLMTALRDCGRIVIPVNLIQLKKHPWRILKIFFTLLIHPKSNVIISSSLKRCGWLIKMFYRINSGRNICFVGTGCEFSQTIAQGRFNAKYFRNISNIIVQGATMKEELATVGLNSMVLPNFKKITALPDLKARVDDGIVRFVFLARIRTEKGVDLILKSAERLCDAGLDKKFTIDFYGAFEDKDYQKQTLSKIANMPNVHYKGVLNLVKPTGYEILSQHSIMLFPTYWPGEGFPGIIIDALIAGLPIIASDWHFNSSLVEENKTGRIIPHNNEEALYQAMLDVIHNPQTYQAMSAYCQQKAFTYDTKNIINEAFLKKLNM